MIVSGELENVPLLDVLQVLTYSSQTGALFVEACDTTGTVLFDKGAIVCAESSSTRLLLAKAAREAQATSRRAFRRAQLLACLTELLALEEGVFRFKKHDAPLSELAGVDLTSFYAAGALPTAEVLLVLATAIDKKETTLPETSRGEEGERAHQRYSPTLIEAEICLGSKTLTGFLTNVSAGGAFFQGDVLPEVDVVSEIRFELPGEFGTVVATARIAWARAEAKEGERGVGLAFEAMTEEDKKKLEAYLERFEQLATDMDLAGSVAKSKERR